MTLTDPDREFVMEIDSNREITITPAKDRVTLVLGIRDPHAIAVVELTMSELDVLITELERHQT